MQHPKEVELLKIQVCFKLLPYTPNKYEHLILLNRKILDDQMNYLISKVPKHSRLRC